MSARWYPVVHGLEGLGLLGVGILTQDPLHTACLIVIVSAMSVGLLVIARRFWSTPRWRGWAWFTVVCGLWPMVAMPFFGMALNPHSGLNPYAGLIERLATSPDIVWGLVILLPLWLAAAPIDPTPSRAAAAIEPTITVRTRRPIRTPSGHGCVLRNASALVRAYSV